MATHSSLIKKILWTEEPGGLLSIGSHRVRHDWSDLAAAAAAAAYWFPKWLHQFAFSSTGYRGSLPPHQHLLFVDFSVIATLVQKIYMHPNVHSSIIYGSQGMEAPVFINSWVDKENVYLYILLLFSHQIVSDFLQPHGLQCARPPCPFPSLRVCSSSCPLNQWCHTNIHKMLYIYIYTHTYIHTHTHKMEY